MRLKGKTAIVTGAAHGIGRAIADLFGEEGAHVLIADVDDSAGKAVAHEIHQKGGTAEFISCDVSALSQVATMVARGAEKTGRIEILCNNAAYVAKQWHASAEAS